MRLADVKDGIYRVTTAIEHKGESGGAWPGFAPGVYRGTVLRDFVVLGDGRKQEFSRLRLVGLDVQTKNGKPFIGYIELETIYAELVVSALELQVDVTDANEVAQED